MFSGYKVILLDYLSRLIRLQSLAVILALLLLALVFVVIRKKTVFDTRTLSYGALAVAASFVLYYLRIVEFPNGGSITIASMLPIFVLAYIAGPRAGITAGLCFGLIHYIQEPFLVHWAQFLLDYPLAFASLGLAGLFRKNICIGAVLGSTVRLLMHFLSGVVFFGSYANGQNVFLYSFIYNASYVLPDMIICIIILALPSVRAMVARIGGMAEEAGVQR